MITLRNHDTYGREIEITVKNGDFVSISPGGSVFFESIPSASITKIVQFENDLYVSLAEADDFEFTMVNYFNTSLEERPVFCFIDTDLKPETIASMVVVSLVKPNPALAVLQNKTLLGGGLDESRRHTLAYNQRTEAAEDGMILPVTLLAGVSAAMALDSTANADEQSSDKLVVSQPPVTEDDDVSYRTPDSIEAAEPHETIVSYTRDIPANNVVTEEVKADNSDELMPNFSDNMQPDAQEATTEVVEPKLDYIADAEAAIQNQNEDKALTDTFQTVTSESINTEEPKEEPAPSDSDSNPDDDPVDNNIIMGTENNDVLTGGDNDETIIGLAGDDELRGGDGNDYLDGGEGNDINDAGAGDDVVIYDAADKTLNSGGEGNDTLRVESGDINFLVEDHGTYLNFENIDMKTDTGFNMVHLDKNDVLDMMSNDDGLFIQGNAMDGVYIETGPGSFTKTGFTTVNGIQYEIWTSGDAILNVEEGVDVIQIF